MGGPERSDSRPISEALDEWLSKDDPTVGNLINMFGPQSFAVVFVAFMVWPALPLPTGGVTHVFEVIVMLLSLELVAGRTEIWLPRRLRERRLKVKSARARRMVVRRMKQLERLSRRRWSSVLERRPANVVFGLAVLTLTVVAFLAPPFSGLDTIPSLGVVLMSLGMLLGDALIAGAGLAVGAAGVAVVVGLGRALVHLL